MMLVGETCCEETAQIAFKAGLTGYLAMATLYTNNTLQLLAAPGKSWCRASTDCGHPSASTFPAFGLVCSGRPSAGL